MVEVIDRTFSLFISPEQRLYWPVLLSSLLFAYIYSKDFKFFSREGLFHPSSLVDLKLLVINMCLKVFLFPLFLISSFQVSVAIHKGMAFILPGFQGLEFSSLGKAVFATFLAFVVSDFLRFAQHLLMHEFSFLSKFHQTHHSAQVLTPFTLFRTHPLESFFGVTRGVLSMGIVLALYSFLFKGRVSAIDILGVNAFGFVFNALLANLRHSPVPISFGPFEYLFISPRMHQIHHSREKRHFNKNYGVALAIWDQLWGTYYRPEYNEAKDLKFGFRDNKQAQTLKGALIPDLSLNYRNVLTSDQKYLIKT